MEKTNKLTLKKILGNAIKISEGSSRVKYINYLDMPLYKILGYDSPVECVRATKNNMKYN